MANKPFENINKSKLNLNAFSSEKAGVTLASHLDQPKKRARSACSTTRTRCLSTTALQYTASFFHSTYATK